MFLEADKMEDYEISIKNHNLESVSEKTILFFSRGVYPPAIPAGPT
jgi:hypothetical protein